MSAIERLLRREADQTQTFNELVISPMRRRDLRAGVLEIEGASHKHPWSRGVFQSEVDQMGSGTRHYLVARRSREIVGYAGLWLAPDVAHITNVAVQPAGRRAGVATVLLLELADIAIGRDYSAWTLEVRASGQGAQELYRRFGFAPAGVRKRYYEKTEDAIVMWCNEIQSEKYGERLTQIREGVS